MKVNNPIEEYVNYFLRNYILHELWDEYQGIMENNNTYMDFSDYCFENLNIIGKKVLDYIGLDIERFMEG